MTDHIVRGLGPLIVAGLFAAPAAQAAQAAMRACQGQPPVDVAVQEIEAPGFDSVLLSDGADRGQPLARKPNSAVFVLGPREVELADGFISSGKSPVLQFINASDSSKSCQRSLTGVTADVAAAPEEAPVAAGGIPAGPRNNATPVNAEVSLTECQTASGKYYEQIRTNRRRLGLDPEFSLVVFCGKGTAYQESLSREDGGRWGRPIYAAVAAAGMSNIRFEYPNCAPEGDGPRGYISGSFKAAQVQAAGELALMPDVSGDRQGVFRSCYNDSVDIVLKADVAGGAAGQEVNRYTLNQAKTYHFTTQLGVLFTDDVTRSFAVTDDGTGTTRIRDTGPVDDGPRYFASVVLYSLPQQLASLVGGKAYEGRALQKDTGFADRIGLLIGVGLEDPGDEFVAGLTFEVMTGLNVTLTNRWAKIEQLDGVSVGDPFAGAADTLPKQEKWEQSFSVGIALDLRYVAALFNRD